MLPPSASAQSAGFVHTVAFCSRPDRSPATRRSPGAGSAGPSQALAVRRHLQGACRRERRRRPLAPCGAADPGASASPACSPGPRWEAQPSLKVPDGFPPARARSHQPADPSSKFSAASWAPVLRPVPPQLLIWRNGVGITAGAASLGTTLGESPGPQDLGTPGSSEVAPWPLPPAPSTLGPWPCAPATAPPGREGRPGCGALGRANVQSSLSRIAFSEYLRKLWIPSSTGAPGRRFLCVSSVLRVFMSCSRDQGCACDTDQAAGLCSCLSCVSAPTRHGPLPWFSVRPLLLQGWGSWVPPWPSAATSGGTDPQPWAPQTCGSQTASCLLSTVGTPGPASGSG